MHTTHTITTPHFILKVELATTLDGHSRLGDRSDVWEDTRQALMRHLLVFEKVCLADTERRLADSDVDR